MGVSENSVPLNPMVNDHYPYKMAISLGIYPIFRQTHITTKSGISLTAKARGDFPFRKFYRQSQAIHW